MTTTMRRWAIDAIGRERLAMHEVPLPTPGPVLDSRHAFAHFPAALARLDAGPFGKVVIHLGNG